MPKTGPRPNARGPRPQCWISGPDPLLHQQYRAFIQQRNQAQWRSEFWQLEFEDWLRLWQPHWHQRGRRQCDYCMVRKDPEDSWTLDNVEVIERSEHCQRHRARQGITRGRRSQIKDRTYEDV